MNPYKEHTEREWFVKGTVRGDIRQVEDEDEARRMVGWNPAAKGVVLYRDVHFGPLTEVEK